MRVEYTPSFVDFRVLKSLTASQKEDLVKKGLDIDKLEKSLTEDLEKAVRNPAPGNPVSSPTMDRSNLVPVKETVTRNGRQQMTTVWKNPNKNDDDDDQKDGQQKVQDQADQESEQGGAGKEFIASDGTRVSLKPSGNQAFPYTVTITDNTGKREIRRVSSQKLAQQEVTNIVGNMDQASERAMTQNISNRNQGK